MDAATTSAGTHGQQGSHGTGGTHLERFEHTGPAIREEYYPQYATVGADVTPLYSTEVYNGAALILLSMAMLGLPLTALGFWTDDMGISLTLVIVAVVVDVAVFLAGLALCMHGFRKHARKDGHH